MSYIIYTCDCGAKAKVYQYNLDGPYRRPMGWSRDGKGEGICPDCTQAVRDGVHVRPGDRVSWTASPCVPAGSGVVRFIAVHYGRVSVIVQSDPGDWRTQHSVPPSTVTSLEPKTIAEKLDAAQDGQEFGAVLSGLFSALERARDNEEEEQ